MGGAEVFLKADKPAAPAPAPPAKAMPTHPEQTQAAGGEAAQPEAQAAEDNSATAKYAHILNPAKQPTASEMQGYKRLKTKLDQRKRERMQRDNDQAQRKQMR